MGTSPGLRVREGFLEEVGYAEYQRMSDRQEYLSYKEQHVRISGSDRKHGMIE